MPKMTLNRAYTLNSVLGHSIRFEKGEPTYVPPGLTEEALKIGAEFAETGTAKPDITGEEAAAPEPLTGDLREERLRELVFGFMKNGSDPSMRDMFTAGGSPRVEVVARALGGKVHANEVTKYVDEYRVQLPANP